MTHKFTNPKIVSSSLLRAVETAKHIGDITGIRISDTNSQFDNLNERYYGDYRLVSSIDEIPSDFENEDKFRERVYKGLFEVFLKYKDADPLIIVSHQKVFEYITKLLSGSSDKICNGEIAYFTCTINY